MKFHLTILSVLLFFKISAQTPCQNGKAGGYDCLGLDLQAHVTALELGAESLGGNWCNDIWGWTDALTGKEYALVGMTNGTSFVDISNPTAPVVLGMLPEHNFENARIVHDGAKSVWRDIKVYKDHAFIVSEDEGHGVQIFDLTQLRDVVNPSKGNRFAETAHYSNVSNAHNIVINESTGFAYAVGSTATEGECSGGGLHIFNIQNPSRPKYQACFDQDGYTHDAQCVIYHGPDSTYFGKEICFNSNEDELTIVDVNDKDDIKIIGQGTYDGVFYFHQGWLTEDHKFFLSNDEVDELRTSNNTRTYIWNVENLDEPILIGFHEHNTAAIDHNLYIKENQVYQSNYTAGLRILNTDQISEGKLREVAFFDTFSSSDAAIFSGTWSNYPFFESGNVVINDITNGLFIVKQSEFFIAAQPQDQLHCVGDHIDIPIAATGNNLTYVWQIKTPEESVFIDLVDVERYHSMNTDSLHGHMVQLDQNGNHYRCLVVKDGVDTLMSDAMILTVIDTAHADFSVTYLSQPGGVSFENVSTNAVDYRWDFGDESVATGEAAAHAYQAGGLYQVRLMVENECSSDTATQLVDVVIIKSQPQNAAILENESASFTVLAEGNNLAYQWQVESEGVFVDLISTSEYEGINDDTLTIVANSDARFNQFRCVVTSEGGRTVTTNTVSSEIVLSSVLMNKVKIYPSPAKDYIMIESEEITEQNSSFLIFDLNGKSKAFNAENNRIDISALSSGMYFLYTSEHDYLGRFLVGE